MENPKIANMILSGLILLLSVLCSYLIVVRTVDLEVDIVWFIHLFFGDKKVYFFNIIPMATWALVQLIKFILLSALIASLLFSFKRLLLYVRHNILPAYKNRGL